MATIEGFSWAGIVANSLQHVYENEGIIYKITTTEIDWRQQMSIRVPSKSRAHGGEISGANARVLTETDWPG
jgi:hypothetical protein